MLTPRGARLLVFAAFALLLQATSTIYKIFFPLPGLTMGHDHSLAMPAYIDGFFWFRNNGFAIPWFSPSFCAGQPYFADPQSSFYSLIQLLVFFTDPVSANYLLLLILSAAEFWGGYFLLRNVFGTDQAAAVAAGGILMLNEFLPGRIAIGHLGFHGFALVSWVAVCLLQPQGRKIDNLAFGAIAGLILAYWVHSGMGTLMVPAGIGVLIIALVYGLAGRPLGIFLMRSVIAVVVALCISASKLIAAKFMMVNFPRDFYLLPGMKSIGDTLTVFLSSLFLGAESTYTLATPRLTNSQWALQPHEWGFSFTPIILAVGVLLLLYRLKDWRQLIASWRGYRSAGLLLALLLSLAWPVAFNTYEPGWNALLKSLPLLGSASTPTRWIIVYIPCIAVLVALGLQQLPAGEATKWCFAISCLALTVMLTAMEPRGFYKAQTYDVRPMVSAYRAAQTGTLNPIIRELGTEINISAPEFSKTLHSNDTFIAGLSQIFCYNPTFGYRLEKFNPQNLAVGQVLIERDGLLNLKNPACYVFPTENHCKPGDLFRADQIEDAKRFVSYRPFEFEMPRAQKLANVFSAWSLWATVFLILMWSMALLTRTKVGPQADWRSQNPSPK
jgi:hypothetical protein